MTLYFRIEPVDGPAPAAGMFIVCWPGQDGDGRYLHNAHPDRRVLDSVAGDACAAATELPDARGAAVQRLDRAVVRQRAGVLGCIRRTPSDRRGFCCARGRKRVWPIVERYWHGPRSSSSRQ